MRGLLLILAICLFAACSTTRPAKQIDTGTGKQTYNWKRAILPASLSFVSGASWGVHETIVHHPDRIPDSWNKRFWDSRESWRNKYRGGNPDNGPAYLGSTTLLAWTTDAKHLFGTAHRVTGFAAGISIGIGDKRPCWHYAADAGVSFIAFGLGFHSIYSLAFKQ